MKRYLQAAYKPDGKLYTFHTEEDLQPGDPIQFTTPRGGVLKTTVDSLHPPDYTPPAHLAVTTPVYKASQ